jgi:hypothetical protein
MGYRTFDDSPFKPARCLYFPGLEVLDRRIPTPAQGGVDQQYGKAAPGVDSIYTSTLRGRPAKDRKVCSGDS